MKKDEKAVDSQACDSNLTDAHDQKEGRKMAQEPTKTKKPNSTKSSLVQTPLNGWAGKPNPGLGDLAAVYLRRDLPGPPKKSKSSRQEDEDLDDELLEDDDLEDCSDDGRELENRWLESNASEAKARLGEGGDELSDELQEDEDLYHDFWDHIDFDAVVTRAIDGLSRGSAPCPSSFHPDVNVTPLSGEEGVITCKITGWSQKVDAPWTFHSGEIIKLFPELEEEARAAVEDITRQLVNICIGDPSKPPNLHLSFAHYAPSFEPRRSLFHKNGESILQMNADYALRQLFRNLRAYLKKRKRARSKPRAKAQS